MKLSEKIIKLRREKRLSRQKLYERLQKIFGNKAIKPNTIWRIEKGISTARLSSLYQLATGLEVSLETLLEDYFSESKLVDIIRKDKRVDRYIYNPQVYADILTPLKRSFSVQELILAKGGKTSIEADPLQPVKFEKWVYCLSGKINCIIGQETHTLNKGDCLSFESNIPHYFENNFSRKARVIIVHSPKRL